MADEQQQPEQRVLESALDSATGRFLARVSIIDNRRPTTPTSFTGQFPGVLRWTAPSLDNFTHFRLRIEHDDGEPDYEIPKGQTSIRLPTGRAFFLSTYNQTSRLESPFSVLVYDVEKDFRTLIQNSIPEVAVTGTYTLTTSPFPIPCSPYPQPGHVLYVYLIQDATGSREPAWGDCYHNAPTTAVDGTASTLSVVVFSYREIAGTPKWEFVTLSTGLAST